MTQFLPPNLLALFAPRDPVPFLPPVDKLTHEKRRKPYTGLADYLTYFEDPEDTPLPVHIETKAEKLERKRREKAEQVSYKLEQDLALWDPQNNTNATMDPYKTLFVARISYDTSESKLRREFEAYGKIKQIKMINDMSSGKPRGYAFVEYEEESDMHAAYKRADGKKIDGRRVVVDIERGRTIEGWKPRRLGGGKGGRVATKSALDTSQTGRISSHKYDDYDGNVSSSGGGGGGGRSKSEYGVRRSSRERKRSRSRSRERGKKRSKSRDRHRSRSRDNNRVKKSRHGSRSRDRKDHRRKRSRSKENKHGNTSDNGHNSQHENNNGY